MTVKEPQLSQRNCNGVFDFNLFSFTFYRFEMALKKSFAIGLIIVTLLVLN
ncbi:hypothetical protein QCB44_08880 [Thiomicrorhabdus sp. zzn3]|uniref:hypothetical protein n=1 Tax=Thiomicrorhabdus sp. zzn3 TaxID=3039775 RepID=UPI0024370C80|nr:hypothetical protein [Thiomicrorhabdus sp. zzn3]MDG6778818.1 hypothetical protein [Thiomicrorhabdus sp. zzn3]